MKRTTYIFFAAVIFLTASAFAQVPDFNWVSTAGGSQSDYMYDMKCDAAGNTYVTGKFKSDPMDFGNGVTISTLGNYDMYIAKYDPTGQVVWARSAGSVGSASPDEGDGVAVDASGNVIVTGAFFGTAYFNGGTDSLTSHGNFDLFIAKYDASGNFLWVVQGSGLKQDKGQTVAVDYDGNYLVAGYFGDDNGADTLAIGGFTLQGYGDRTVFVVKLQPDGTALWGSAAGSSVGSNYANDITVDPLNNAYIAGAYKGTIYFSATDSLENMGDYDGYIAKIDKDGNWGWYAGMNGPNYDGLRGIDYVIGFPGVRADIIAVTGYFEDTTHVGDSTYYSWDNDPDDDIFLGGFDVNGIHTGGGTLGGYGDDEAFDIVGRSDGTVWICGYAKDDIYTWSGDTLFNSGYKDALLFGFDATDTRAIEYASLFGGSKDDAMYDLDFDQSGLLYTAGYFKSPTFDIPPFTLNNTGGSSSYYDIFLGAVWSDLVPVELTAFSAEINGDAVTLEWKTATETNNSGFEVQKSSDNQVFSKIGFVDGQGNSAQVNSYSYVDRGVNGVVYYRLKQIDYDGSFTYSDVVEVDMTIPHEYTVSQNYPNPFNPETSIKFELPFASRVTISVYNVLGELVTNIVNADYEAGRYTVNFNAAGFSSGVYFYNISAEGNNGTRFASTKKMILMK